MQGHNPQHHHHILPTKTALTIGGTLLVLTCFTVWIAGVDLGHMNFPVAMAVATVKALLVAMFFMNLKYDSAENSVIFGTSFLFLAIFIVLTSTDLFFRGNVYHRDPIAKGAPGGPPKFKKAWIVTPDLVSHGKEHFKANCVSCHGENGKGDGPAAAALNPRPRDFTNPTGWKNGRKPTMVFKTLKEGIPGTGMGAFTTLPSEDRWALAHYVLSLGPKPDADTATDFAKIGIDPSKEGGAEAQAATIPVDLAMQRYAQPDPKGQAQVFVANRDRPTSAGGKIYEMRCLECHGPQGGGGVRVARMGGMPKAYVTTQPLAQASAMQSLESFKRVVTQGLSGRMMPASGDLGGSELNELYGFVRSLAGR